MSRTPETFVPSSTELFQSFFMGGFECATHRRRDRTQLDVISVTKHDQMAVKDYRMLAEAGVRTVRDGIRWHLIDQVPYRYDWSSFTPMLEAAHAAGVQVLWDLCHWGIPVDIDIFSPEFVDRFAVYSTAAATLIRDFNQTHGITRPQVYCPINEISFWAWVGGDVEHFYPYGEGLGPELKEQLVRASIAGTRAVRSVDPSARFLQAEPLIHVAPDDDRPDEAEGAATHTEAQFEAWNMIAGRDNPDLGGSEDCLDILGVNYYWNNQWVQHAERVPPGHHLHRPLHEMLVDVSQRYKRPIIISETGCEAGAAPGWLAYVSAEVRLARRLGADVLGICLYPVMDYPGWDDERHCPVGLIAADDDWTARTLRSDLCEELRLQTLLLSQ